LLRSAAVSGWPGLEVRAYDAGGASIDPVRLDHVASDVLLALFPAAPARIEIDEPKEALAFGVEDDGIVDLRYVSGPSIGTTTGAQATLGAQYLRDTTRVIDIAAWQKTLAGTSPDPVWGPAAFAVQMVRAPEQMIFTDGNAT
jgi:hypothetical protein